MTGYILPMAQKGREDKLRRVSPCPQRHGDYTKLTKGQV